MEEQVSPEDIKVKVLRRPIKNMYLRILPSGEVVLSAPLSISDEEIEKFMQSKKRWMWRHLAVLPEQVEYHYTNGESHYYLGHPAPLHIIPSDETRVHFRNGKILMYVTPGIRNFKKLYVEWAKNALWDVVADYCDKWAYTMGVEFSTITIKNVKSRWGSCNVKTGDLTFSLDLITKPKPCIELVVVHELNHLLEKGHTPRFYELMKGWLPDCKKREKVLKTWPREFA